MISLDIKQILHYICLISNRVNIIRDMFIFYALFLMFFSYFFAG